MAAFGGPVVALTSGARYVRCAIADRTRGNSNVRKLNEEATDMTIQIVPLVALIAGILILIVPRLLNYVVALYLIFIGLIGLFPELAARLSTG
jgi:hypothetical protein